MTGKGEFSRPRLYLSPGPEYADEVRMFQGIPALERAPSGRLWAAWYGGGVTEDRYNYVLLVTSGDDGRTWSGPRLVIDPDGPGPLRAFDPCLWHDPLGRLWLFWAQGLGEPLEQGHMLWAISTANPDAENPTWSEPRRIAPGVMMNKPLVLSSGEWLLPVARWHAEGSAGVYVSTDRGAAWKVRGQANIPSPADRNCDEHMLVERRDGTLWLLARTMYGIGESISMDRGHAWTEVQPFSLKHATTRFFARRLRSGRLLLVKHGPLQERTSRSHLTAYLSDDDGHAWFGGLLIDERLGVSYPDGVQAPDDALYLIYDYDRQGAKEILMCTFTEEDVVQGAFVSPRAAGRILVNRALGANPEQAR
jgi:predicted neuraminidase